VATPLEAGGQAHSTAPLTVSGAEKRVADKTLDVTDWQFVKNSL
jgi:hypothetical protein